MPLGRHREVVVVEDVDDVVDDDFLRLVMTRYSRNDRQRPPTIASNPPARIFVRVSICFPPWFLATHFLLRRPYPKQRRKPLAALV